LWGARYDLAANQRGRAAAAIDELLSDVQTSLFQTARDEQERRTLREPSGYDEMIEFLRDAAGFVAAPWCGRRECEARIKDESSATIRCLPLAEQRAQASACVCCGRTPVTAAVRAQAH
jgi:prolyl-tRNA synthetase